MSGPIVRKYGFPNFEKIFGHRELEHGVDEGETAGAGEARPSEQAAEKAPATDAATEQPEAAKAPGKAK
jgi:hypothetical protein